MAKYKKRADGRYLAQIQIGYQDNGNPKFKNLYGRTIADLDQKVVDFKSNLNKGIIIDDKNLTVGEWAEIWLKEYKQNVTQRTRDKYELTIKNQLDPIKGIRLSKLSINNIQKLLNDMFDKGFTGHIRFTKITISQILKQAIINEMIYKNASLGVKLPLVEAEQRRAIYEAERNSIYAADLTLKERCFCYLCLYAGLRRGEALALMKNDIDLKNNEISINKTLIYNKNAPEVKNGAKTKAGTRNIPIIEPLKSVLEEYLKSIESLYIFTTRHNTLTTKTSMANMWEMILRKVNAKMPNNETTNITPHYLRHTYATDLYYANVDIKTCQYLLGHASTKTTLDIYTTFKNDNESTANKLKEYFLAQSKISQSEEN